MDSGHQSDRLLSGATKHGFSAGLTVTGTVAAFIETLKNANDLARWGASIGPFIMALGTGSAEAAIWAFNQAVTVNLNLLNLSQKYP